MSDLAWKAIAALAYVMFAWVVCRRIDRGPYDPYKDK